MPVVMHFCGLSLKKSEKSMSNFSVAAPAFRTNKKQKGENMPVSDTFTQQELEGGIRLQAEIIAEANPFTPTDPQKKEEHIQRLVKDLTKSAKEDPSSQKYLAQGYRDYRKAKSPLMWKLQRIDDMKRRNEVTKELNDEMYKRWEKDVRKRQEEEMRARWEKQRSSHRR